MQKFFHVFSHANKLYKYSFNDKYMRKKKEQKYLKKYCLENLLIFERFFKDLLEKKINEYR